MSPHQLVKSILIFALAGYAVSGFTADITIANGQEVLTTQSSTADGDVITIEEGGKVTVNGITAVTAINNNVTFNNAGIITTTGNTAHGLNTAPTNNLTVNNSGSITTSGDNANGLLSFTTNSDITNSGSILTIGNAAQGISISGANSSITNTGSITVQGNNSDGILSTTTATINNSGTISTSGTNGNGIRSNGNNSSVTNSGTISTTGTNSIGISANATNVTITNSGRINALTRGISSNGNNATIINSGMITVPSVGGNGIRANGADSNIENTGEINVTGVSGVGVNLNATRNTLTNGGLISASGSATTAILGSAGDQTVNLETGSKLLGIIDLGGGSDTVNILGVSPSAQLTLVGVENINISSGVAAVVSGNTVTTVDPTGDSVRGTSLSVMTAGVHNVVTRRAMNTKKLKPVQLASLELTPGMLYQERGPLAWGEVFGARRTRNSENNVAAHHHSYAGFIGGYERDFQKARVGVMAGYANSNIETDVVSIDTNTNSFFAGGYGHFYLGAINLTAIVLGGYEEHDNDRIVFDNLNGIQNASSEFDSVFFSPSITLSSALKLSDNYEFRPSGTVAYTASWYDSYTELGTTASNLIIDDRLTHAINSRVQLAAAYLGNEHSEVELRLGAKSRHVDEDDIQATLAGTNFRYSSTADENEYGGFVGANVKVAVLDKLHFVTDLEYAIMNGDEDEREASARLSLDYLF